MRYNHLNYEYKMRWASENDHWLHFGEVEGWDFDDMDPFVYFLARLQCIFNDTPLEVGEGRYKFAKDPNHFIYQWDDLFGMVAEYHCSLETAKFRLQKLINQVNDMSRDTKLASEEGPEGVDRWTSNGYGVVLGEDNATERLEAIDIINREMAEKEKRRKQQ